MVFYSKQQGSSLTFSALGGWGKEKKNNSAKNSVRPSEGAAEGGCGGNSAAPERIKIAASPAALLIQSRATQKSFLFLLEEKIGARKSGKAKKTFLWGSAGFPHGGGAASLVGVLFKKCSNFVQKRPPIYTFADLRIGCLAASPLGIEFCGDFPSIFQIQNQRPFGNAEVPVRKHRENGIFRTNLFSFAFGERQSDIFCPKAI